MRKILMAAALLAPMLLASCDREPENGNLCGESEMSLSPVCDGTKGYVDGNTLFEGENPRTIYLSAYNQTTKKNLFIGYTYRRSDDDGTWKNFIGETHEPFYWPLGAVVNFLAFSVGNGSASVRMAEDARWSNSGNASSEVTLELNSLELLQDDILYAVNSDCRVSAGSPELSFRHAQALVEFIVDSEKENVTVQDIKLKSVFVGGRLTLANNYGTPTCKWDFPDDIGRVDYTLHPENGLIPSEGVLTMRLLLPSQQVLSSTRAEITYEVPNETSGTTVKTGGIEFGHSTWLSGESYSYRVHLK